MEASEIIQNVLGNWELIGFVLSTIFAIVQKIKSRDLEGAILQFGDLFNEERLKNLSMRRSIEKSTDTGLKKSVEVNAEVLNVKEELHSDVKADKERSYATPIHELYGRNQTVRKVADIITALSGIKGIFSKK